MRRGGAGKRRDSNEPQIIDGLRAIGCRVYQISGANLPDLLVCYRHRWMPLAVKTKTGALTESEQAGVPWPIVRSLDEAMQAIWS